MLLAPSPGEETRSSIVGKVHDFGDKVRERFSPEVKKPATGTEEVGPCQPNFLEPLFQITSPQRCAHRRKKYASVPRIFCEAQSLSTCSYADFRTGRVPSKTDGSPVRSSYSIEPSIFSLMLAALHLLIASSFSRKN